jgi:hypothetical protein
MPIQSLFESTVSQLGLILFSTVFSAPLFTRQFAFHRIYYREALVTEGPWWTSDSNQEKGSGRQSRQGRKCTTFKHKSSRSRGKQQYYVEYVSNTAQPGDGAGLEEWY